MALRLRVLLLSVAETFLMFLFFLIECLETQKFEKFMDMAF